MQHYADMTIEDTEKEQELPQQAPTDSYYRVDLPSLISPDDNDDWRKLGACLTSSVDFFNGHKKDKAKAVCVGCAVTEACLSFAIRNGEAFGVWGGLDEDERRAIR